MPEQLPFTALLNRIFAGPVDALLRALHIEPKFPQAPIPNAVAMEVLVVGFLILVFLLCGRGCRWKIPVESSTSSKACTASFSSRAAKIIGHHSESFTPFLVALGLFILICNLLGLIPGFDSPTGESRPCRWAAPSPLSSTITCRGSEATGPCTTPKHLWGPMWWLALLMFPIEIISHLARMLSLTIRLFANMFAGDMVTLVFFSLVPLGVPVIFMGLHIGVSFLQAYIFVLLETVYLSGAVATEH